VFNVPFQHKYGYIRDEATELYVMCTSVLVKLSDSWDMMLKNQPLTTTNDLLSVIVLFVFTC